MTLTLRAMRQAVDRLGELKAAISALEKEEKSIVDRLKENGTGIYAGTLFDANVFAQSRTVVNWQAIADEVGYTVRLKNKYTEVKDVVYCKVTAKR